MIIKFKRYIATVARYVEDDNGNITKRTEEIALEGRRFTDASVLNKIPRECKLISHGWKDEAYEVDTSTLLTFCSVNGKRINEVMGESGGDSADTATV